MVPLAKARCVESSTPNRNTAATALLRHAVPAISISARSTVLSLAANLGNNGYPSDLRARHFPDDTAVKRCPGAPSYVKLCCWGEYRVSVGKRAANRQGKKEEKQKTTPSAINVSVCQAAKRYGLIVLCYAAELLVEQNERKEAEKKQRDTCNKPVRLGLESAYILWGKLPWCRMIRWLPFFTGHLPRSWPRAPP